jgi:D-alanyl-lipoteichoic acid acyltransferase DltB (MBOAT superfamily)
MAATECCGMLFNSLVFVVFFIFVTGLYFLLPHKYRWALLLAASCYFYMFFKPVYILILGFTILIDYYAGILLEQENDKAKKKKYLVMSLIANIGVLAVFKYYNFLNGNITGLADYFGMKNPIPYLNILLPIGLSFHTFQAMSYTIEVYRGHQKAERHFGIYSLYVMFYPQLVAGPIERPQNVLHQFHEEHTFNYENAVSGLRLMLWGMFKKVVIADRLAVVTDMVFNAPEQQSAVATVIASVLFTFQIFCDFSGYSDIALGSARVMGFHLMKNFDRPYSSVTISEFWRRWHISLSTWFRDYLYIPLGGNRVPYMRRQFNLFVVFLVSGLWHGADWKFIIWGALHGVFLVLANVTYDLRLKVRKAIGLEGVPWLNRLVQQSETFVLVTIAWIFFRANNMHDALVMIGKIPAFFGEVATMARTGNWNYGIPIAPFRLALCFVVIAILESVHLLQRNGNVAEMIDRKPTIVRWVVYYTLLLAIIYLGVFSNREFIYFQF